jgi:hypothetical protein
VASSWLTLLISVGLGMLWLIGLGADGASTWFVWLLIVASAIVLLNALRGLGALRRTAGSRRERAFRMSFLNVLVSLGLVALATVGLLDEGMATRWFAWLVLASGAVLGVTGVAQLYGRSRRRPLPRGSETSSSVTADS